MKCTNCGKDNQPNASFCEDCGSKLTETSQSPSTSPAAAAFGTAAAGAGAAGMGSSGQYQSSAQFQGNSQGGSYQSGQYQSGGYGTSQANGNFNQYYQSQPGNTPGYFDPNQLPPEYQPISMWGYFGYQLLFSIPCVGFIILIIFSFGGTKNVNLRNFARSYFCFLIIAALIAFLLTSCGVMGGLMNSFY